MLKFFPLLYLPIFIEEHTEIHELAEISWLGIHGASGPVLQESLHSVFYVHSVHVHIRCAWTIVLVAAHASI